MATHIRYIRDLHQSVFLDGIDGVNPRQSIQPYERLSQVNGKLDHPYWCFSNVEYLDDDYQSQQDDLIDYDDDSEIVEIVNHSTITYLTSKGWVSNWD